MMNACKSIAERIADYRFGAFPQWLSDFLECVLHMQKIHSIFLLILACASSFYAHAEEKSVVITTILNMNVDKAKGAYLRPQANEIIELVKLKNYLVAEKKAIDLCKMYEGIFDASLKQYTFQSKADFDEFNASSVTKFEWIDWGYATCLHIQAFIAAEQKDFAKAVVLLSAIDLVAPISADNAAELGYVLNQLGKPDEGLAAYRRAYDTSMRYPSQRVFRAISLRGMGAALIDLNRLDEAEQKFLESLEIEPGNKLAKNELAYIRKIRDQK
jgi:tetratricopeptide (TPR) repeat protein